MRWTHFIKRYLRRVPADSGRPRNLARFLPGNRLKLLRSGEDAFRAMLQAIDSAHRTIHLETYLFSDDRTGMDFARRLAAKARQGVDVRVIFDAVGSIDTGHLFFAKLARAGVDLLEYHPVAPWRSRWAWARRDHRKLLVVDGKAGFIGGVNISHKHAPLARGGADWNDTHLRLEGPAVHELDRLFRAVWSKETGERLALETKPTLRPGRCLVWVAANQEFLHRRRIRRAYLGALRKARKEVLLANAYFLPERVFVRALVCAARRKVSVRILVPGRSDHPAVWRAGRRIYDRLLRNGVRLFEWPGSVLHSKTAVIDGSWCMAGSYNLDHYSLRQNLEVNLNILDRGLGAEMRADFEHDLARSREITLADWRRRPWKDKVGERFWHLFRNFF